MKHIVRLLVGLLALAFVTGMAVVIRTSYRQQAPVYTVAEVQARLAHSPATWEGRTLRVKGMVLADCHSMDAGRGMPCGAHLVDPDGAGLLLVQRWRPDPLLAALRSLPLLGPLVTAAQVVRAGTLETYRVQLLVAPATTCSAAPCYQALLLDAASGSP